MTLPSLPGEGSTDWYDWSAALDNAVRTFDSAVLDDVATTTTAPSAGGAGALPATPAGYVTVSINGTPRKLPYY